MSMKLGELLISEGSITQGQLDEALKCHIIFGIKLGSSLIELGFIQEDALVDLLSRKLGVSAVSHSELLDVPAEVIDQLSPSVAENFCVIPVRIENKRLYVAMSDPTDLKALEELSFITGNNIVPLIAAEIQILHALEKYYAVSRDNRYVWAQSNMHKKRANKAEGREEGPAIIESKPLFSADFSGNGVFSDFLHLPIPADLPKTSQFGAAADQPFVQRKVPERYTIDRLSLDFSKAKNRDDVANIFIKYLGLGFMKGALMTIRGHSAVGWRAVNRGKQIKNFESITLEITKSSELSEILIGKHYFSGPLSESPANIPLIRALNLGSSDTVLSLPVIMNDRVVAMIVVSSDVISLQQRLDELQKLVYKASLAFQILVFKNKLLQT